MYILETDLHFTLDRFVSTVRLATIIERASVTVEMPDGEKMPFWEFPPEGFTNEKFVLSIRTPAGPMEVGVTPQRDMTWSVYVAAPRLDERSHGVAHRILAIERQEFVSMRKTSSSSPGEELTVSLVGNYCGEIAHLFAFDAGAGEVYRFLREQEQRAGSGFERLRFWEQVGDKDALYSFLLFYDEPRGWSVFLAKIRLHQTRVGKCEAALYINPNPIIESDTRPLCTENLMRFWRELIDAWPVWKSAPAQETKSGGPTYDVKYDARIFKELKDANPHWNKDQLADEAMRLYPDLGKKNADRVRYVYRQMGWEWERGDRIR